MNRKQCAEYLKVNQFDIMIQTQTGYLPHYHTKKGRVKYRVSEIDAYLKKLRAQSFANCARWE